MDVWDRFLPFIKYAAPHLGQSHGGGHVAKAAISATFAESLARPQPRARHPRSGVDQRTAVEESVSARRGAEARAEQRKLIAIGILHLLESWVFAVFVLDVSDLVVVQGLSEAGLEPGLDFRDLSFFDDHFENILYLAVQVLRGTYHLEIWTGGKAGEGRFPSRGASE